ncbi:hypothetical protein EDB80DRAFT_126118 [Ilyonectria destructans]|nr:hypothetical protein EDB80DRAFT_126118 [Ilyonectria destructans]
MATFCEQEVADVRPTPKPAGCMAIWVGFLSHFGPHATQKCGTSVSLHVGHGNLSASGKERLREHYSLAETAMPMPSHGFESNATGFCCLKAEAGRNPLQARFVVGSSRLRSTYLFDLKYFSRIPSLSRACSVHKAIFPITTLKIDHVWSISTSSEFDVCTVPGFTSTSHHCSLFIYNSVMVELNESLLCLCAHSVLAVMIGNFQSRTSTAHLSPHPHSG